MKFVHKLLLDDDSGWERLDVHACQVKTLYMEPLHIEISPNICLRICAIRNSPLLPGLKNIYIPYNLEPLISLLLSSWRQDLPSILSS